jgi:hypothetical protein
LEIKKSCVGWDGDLWGNQLLCHYQLEFKLNWAKSDSL